jgi:LPXTG-motif cell wall-anchored protein
VNVLVDGSPRVATVVHAPDGLNITSGAFTWHLASALGTVRLNTVDGALALRTDGTLQVWGVGAGGASPLDVWLHSDPTHLGRLSADVSGGFNGTLPIPDGTPAGVHTVRVAGVAQDGSAVQLEVGVVLTAGSGSLPHTGANTSSTTSQTALAFLLLGAALVLMTRRRVET